MYLTFTPPLTQESETSDIPAQFVEAMKHVKNNSKGDRQATIRSHSLKRSSVSDLQENLPAHSFVARCGFVVKNIHTIFEYFFNSKSQDMQSALVLGGWMFSVGGSIQGGIPPEKSSIVTAPDKLQPFISTLFRT